MLIKADFGIHDLFSLVEFDTDDLTLEIRSFGAGECYSAAVSANGLLYMWGQNFGSTINETMPNATAPLESRTPRKLKKPDHMTANSAGSEWV